MSKLSLLAVEGDHAAAANALRDLAWEVMEYYFVYTISGYLPIDYT